MKIGIVLDNSVNQWMLQLFEPLKKEHDITVFIGERNKYDTSAVALEKHFLRHGTEISLAIRSPITSYHRVIRAPFKEMDFYYFSLKRFLRDMDIVCSVDIIRSAYTLASLKEELGFKMLLFWFENIPYRVLFNPRETIMKKSIMGKVDLFLPFTLKAQRALQLEGIAEGKLKMIYPGVDTDRFQPGPKPEDIMAANKIAKGSLIILYVGQLVSWKGVHNLVYAARSLKQKKISDFTFAVAGRGSQKENMKKLIRESGTEEHFRFLDFVPYSRIPEVYRIADICLLPSYPTMTWQEQFGYVLVEAMATGKAVIAAHTGSIPEVVGDAGILNPPGDFEALVDSILRLRDERVRKEMGNVARERSVKLFCSRKNAQKFSQVLKEIKP